MLINVLEKGVGFLTHSHVRLDYQKGVLGKEIDFKEISISKQNHFHLTIKEVRLRWSLLKTLIFLKPHIEQIEVKKITWVGSDKQSNLEDLLLSLDKLKTFLFSLQQINLPEIHYADQKISCSTQGEFYSCTQGEKVFLRIEHLSQSEQMQFDFNLKHLKLEQWIDPLAIEINLILGKKKLKGDITLAINQHQIQSHLVADHKLTELRAHLPLVLLNENEDLAVYELGGDAQCTLELNQHHLNQLGCIVKEGRLQHPSIGTLKHIGMKMQQEKNKLIISSLSASQKNQVILTGRGAIDLNQPQLDLNMNFKRLGLFLSDRYELFLNASLENIFNKTQGSVSGKVTIDGFTKKNNHALNLDVPTLKIEETQNKQTRNNTYDAHLNLKIKALKPIHIKDKGVSVEIQPDLHVTGTVKHAVTSGKIHIERGVIDLLDNQFIFKPSQIMFVDNQTQMQLLLETDWQAYRIQLHISGSVSEPRVNFSSQPALAQNEILSRLLFGVAYEDLSPLQIVQLLKVLSDFKKGAHDQFDPSEHVKQLLKLDSLVLKHLPGSGYGVGVVKHLGKKTTIGVTQSFGDDGLAASIRVKLSKQLELEGKSGTNEIDSNLKLKWKKHF